MGPSTEKMINHGNIHERNGQIMGESIKHLENLWNIFKSRDEYHFIVVSWIQFSKDSPI